MAITTVYTYPLNGSQQDFSVPFEYLARRFVSVTLIGVAGRRKLVLTTDYRFTSSTNIRTNAIWAPSSGYSWVEIRRETSASDRLVDFADGSILRASDLNVSQVQTMHVAEEARNAVTDTIGTDANGNLDARARRIVNVADAVNPGDAVNLNMNQQWAGSALNQANRAEQQANAAAASASQSASSASSAANSVTLTAQYRDTTLTYRNAAETFKNQAGSSQAAAAASESSAAKWAANPEDQLVADTRYSSLHYSRKSAASAAASASSASASAAQVPLASAQADRAKTEADRAKTEADKLGNMNSLAAAFREVNTTGKKVEINAGWEWNADVMAVDGLRSRNSSSIDLNAQLNGRFGASFTGNLSVGGVTSLQNTTVAGLTVNTGAQFKNGNVQVFAPNQSANAHTWFYDSVGNTRGILYAGPDNAVRMQAGQVVCATFAPDGGTTFNNISVGSITARATAYTQGGIENSGRVASYRNGIGVSAGMYANCHFMAQTDDGSPPAYGFHRGGQYALALWLNGNQLQIMDSGGLNREVLNNGNLGGWLVSNWAGIGSVAFCRTAVTATYGVDVAGGNLTYGSTGANGGSVPGTWRCLGWASGGNHTLFIRIA